MTERHACTLLKLSRTTKRYQLRASERTTYCARGGGNWRGSGRSSATRDCKRYCSERVEK
jgi:hypothetical protein